MLVVTRKKGEVMKVGAVEFIILEIDGSRVKIGIVAPREMRASRESRLQARPGNRTSGADAA